MVPPPFNDKNVERRPVCLRKAPSKKAFLNTANKIGKKLSSSPERVQAGKEKSGVSLPLVILNSHPIQYFAPLYRYLADQQLDIQVVYYSGKPGEDKFDKEFGQKIEWDIPLLQGYSSHFLNNHGISKKGSKGFFSRFNPGIIPFLYRQKRSLIVVHSWQYATDIMAIFFARLFGHRLALWTEANQQQELLQPSLKRLIKKCYFKILFSFIDRFFYIGTQNRDFYLAAGIPGHKLLFTPYSVDNQRFRESAVSQSKEEARVQLGLPPKALILLYSGKYIPKKRPLDLLEAVLASGKNHLHLLMVGEGELRSSMEQFISKHHLQNKITLTGFINQSQIPLYYRAADVFIMCSGTGETWGLSVNEAMNFELPVLVSHLTGCSKDLVEEGVNGYVFETGNVQQISQLLQKFLAMPENQLKQMGKKSLAIISGFSYQRFRENIRNA